MAGKFAFFCLALLTILAGCQEAGEQSVPTGTNILTVVGAIHGQHERSDSYSLQILRDAIREFDPDVVMVELPPDRFEIASQNFKQHGEVRENRADDFPELVKVIFPLQEKLDFEMIPVAAWSKAMADERRATLAEIETDPTRAEDWAAYQAAIANYNKAVSGKSDDPFFVHSDEYDGAVKARQGTYEQLFGDDLGAGGWQKINEAHLALMRTALENLAGQEKRILILFGAWHKYKIMEDLEGSKGITVIDARDLFDH